MKKALAIVIICLTVYHVYGSFVGRNYECEKGYFDMVPAVADMTNCFELGKLLDNTNSVAAMSAAKRLGQIKTKEAEDILIAYFESNTYEVSMSTSPKYPVVKLEVLRALQTITNNRVKIFLLKSLNMYLTTERKGKLKYAYSFDGEFSTVVPLLITCLKTYSADEDVYNVSKELISRENIDTLYLRSCLGNPLQLIWELYLESHINHTFTGNDNKAITYLVDLYMEKIHRYNKSDINANAMDAFANAAKYIITKCSCEALQKEKEYYDKLIYTTTNRSDFTRWDDKLYEYLYRKSLLNECIKLKNKPDCLNMILYDSCYNMFVKDLNVKMRLVKEKGLENAHYSKLGRYMNFRHPTTIVECDSKIRDTYNYVLSLFPDIYSDATNNSCVGNLYAASEYLIDTHGLFSKQLATEYSNIFLFSGGIYYQPVDDFSSGFAVVRGGKKVYKWTKYEKEVLSYR